MAKIQLIVCILLYWTMLVFLFSSSLASPFTSDYNVSGTGVNSTGVDLTTEISSGGFFGGIIGVFDAGARFFGLITLGIGLPSSVPTWLQFFVTSLNLIVFIAALGLVVSIFWNG